jgi:hypothetical protein
MKMNKVTLSYKTDEKQLIRELLWDKAFCDLIEKEHINVSELKYFDLPGPECIYLSQLVDKYNFSLNNAVVVEIDDCCTIPIRLFLKGRGILLHGKLENLCKESEIFLHFPFDIINFDFCGQAFVFSGDEYQERWDVIKKFILHNKMSNKKTFYVLLTLLGGRSNRDGRKYLLEQIEELNKISNLNKDPTKWLEAQLIQEALPKIIIDEALDNDYNITFIDSYRYIQEGHTSHMVTFSFKFEAIRKSLGKSIRIKNRMLIESVNKYYNNEPKDLIEIKKKEMVINIEDEGEIKVLEYTKYTFPQNLVPGKEDLKMISSMPGFFKNGLKPEANAIALLVKQTKRHGNFILSACKILGWIDDRNQLSNEGITLANGMIENKTEIIKKAVLNTEIFLLFNHELGPVWWKNPNKEAVISILNTIFNKPSTARRRASTIMAWCRYLNEENGSG